MRCETLSHGLTPTDPPSGELAANLRECYLFLPTSIRFHSILYCLLARIHLTTSCLTNHPVLPIATFQSPSGGITGDSAEAVGSVPRSTSCRTYSPISQNRLECHHIARRQQQRLAGPAHTTTSRASQNVSSSLQPRSAPTYLKFHDQNSLHQNPLNVFAPSKGSRTTTSPHKPGKTLHLQLPKT
jgi:hypothetical protein